MKYARYIEFNDNEGETWHRFIPMTDPCLDKFLDVMKLVEDSDDTYSIEIDREGKVVQYDESYVKVLVDESAMYMNGYMDAYAVCNINEDIFKYVGDYEEAYETLYKMGWAK